MSQFQNGKSKNKISFGKCINEISPRYTFRLNMPYAVIVFNGLGEYACRGNLTKTFDLDDERKKTLQKSKTKKTGEATCPLSGCSFPSVSISKGFWKVIGRIMISTHLTRFSRVQLNCLTGLSPTRLGI